MEREQEVAHEGTGDWWQTGLKKVKIWGGKWQAGALGGQTASGNVLDEGGDGGGDRREEAGGKDGRKVEL